jgi:cell division protein FtsI (penicillin-binding protein 3)
VRGGHDRAIGAVSARRIRATFGVFLLVVTLTFGQLVRVQVLNAEEYAERGVRQRTRTIELPAPRGRIYDREGDVLATSVVSATLYADPIAYRPTTRADGTRVPAAADALQVARAIAPLLGREVEDVVERLQRDTRFVYLARQIDLEAGQDIMAMRLPGIHLLTEPRRVYPAGGLAAQVIGFTGIDGDALQGLEASYDDVLRGVAGTLLLERAPGGLDISTGTRELEPAIAGRDLVLTIDRDIQYVAERVAGQVIADFDAVGATVVVLDVRTGEILGMASAPSFDPAARVESERDWWRNRAVTDIFEPGSTQKALTVAAGLESGAITVRTTFRVPDRYTIGDKTFSDVSPHGVQEWDAAAILSRSSNVGAIRIAEATGVDALRDHLLAFGYGRPTGLGFPGESAGLLPARDQWWQTTLPTVAIGYGTAVTLLQMASAYATIANDGVRVEPRLVRGTVGDDGNLQPLPPAPSQRVISSSTSRIVLELLGEAVSGEFATGSRAQIAGYQVGGKTGTARKPLIGRAGYSDQYVASFVGIAPLDDPRLVVAVMVDEPKPFFGGLVAAPAFAEVMHASLLARRIVPDGRGRSLDELVREARATAASAAARAAEEAEALAEQVAEPVAP